MQLANQPLTCDFCCSEGSGLPIWPAKDSRDHEDLMNAIGNIEKANESMHIEIGKTSFTMIIFSRLSSAFPC